MTIVDVDARYQRERDFHNETFESGRRVQVAKFYSITRNSWKYYEQQLREHGTDRTVLEYGCGPGSYAFFLARRGADVTGIDISDVAIAQARERAQREGVTAHFERMNAEQLEFPDERFDLVCGRAILHHLDLTKAFRELTRVLRPGGVAVFFEPLGHNPLINLYRRLTPTMRTEDEHPLLISDLQFARQQFASVTMRYFHLQSLAAVPFRRMPGFDKLVRVLDASDRMLFGVAPFARKYAWAVVMTLRSEK